MREKPKITVVLTPELKELVDAKVRSGLYCDSGDVIREALRTLDAGADSGEDAQLESLIDAGLKSPSKAVTAAAFDRIRRKGLQLARAKAFEKPRRAP
jgi:putative addiction module CopG family antidote